MTERWDAGLPDAAFKLRTLLRDVDSASAPLWSGRQLDSAIYRYVEIFLPMLAASAGVPGVSGLVDAANKELSTLHKVVRRGELYNIQFNSAERDQYLAPYTVLGKGADVIAVPPIPPLDVAFCWALHRLSPLDYVADCTQLFGAPLPAVNGLDYISVQNAGEERAVTARLQWFCFAKAVRSRQSMIPFRSRACSAERTTYLPSYLWPRYTVGSKSRLFKYTENALFRANWTSPLRYDLIAAAGRQKQFLYNVSHRYFDDEASLRYGVQRYRQFLALMREHPNQFLVPMYDIDLVWHAHILRDTRSYVADTKRLVGRFVNHQEDDDRSEDGDLNAGFRTTAELWRVKYTETYEDDTTNYKGHLPDTIERVFRSGQTQVVRENALWRLRFVGGTVCEYCKKKIAVQMHTKCRKALVKEVRLKRGASARGGACAALYSNGLLGLWLLVRRRAVLAVDLWVTPMGEVAVVREKTEQLGLAVVRILVLRVVRVLQELRKYHPRFCSP